MTVTLVEVIVSSRALARALQIALLGSLWAFARASGMHFGLNYALAMTALWGLLEVAFRVNPGMLNNPGIGEAERSELMELDPAVIGGIVAPVCIGAGVAATLFGIAVTALLATTPSVRRDIAVLIVPAGPMMLGIPLYLVMGRLADVATAIRKQSQARGEGRG